MEALTNLVNAGLQSGVQVLNQMLEAEIKMEVPSIRMLETGMLNNLLASINESSLAVVEMGFEGRLTGNSGLIFEEENAWKFVEKLAGDDADAEGFDFISAGVLTEIGNIVLNRVLGAISNALSLSLDYVVPTFYKGDLDRLWKDAEMEKSGIAGVVAQTRFEVEDMATTGNIILFFDKQSYQTLVAMMENLESAPE